MSIEALGAYLRQLRTAQKMTGKAVAQAIGTNPNYVWRIEQGTMGEPSARRIAAMLRAINGSADDALQLLLDPDARAADGAARALTWLNNRETAGVCDALAPPYALAELHSLLTQLSTHPYELGKIVEYSRQLLDHSVPCASHHGGVGSTYLR